jgi:Winged helix-turn helix
LSQCVGAVTRKIDRVTINALQKSQRNARVVDHGGSRGDGAPLCSVRPNIQIENVIGADSTVYNLLARHQWRKLMPRPFHPNRDVEAQKRFKKKDFEPQ